MASKIKGWSLGLIFLTLSACATNHPENYYFGDYSDAERLYNRGRYEKAIQKYQAYIDENPEGNLAVISMYYTARSHAALGHWDQAKGIYEKIVHEHPDLVWANFSETQLKQLENLKVVSKPGK